MLNFKLRNMILTSPWNPSSIMIIDTMSSKWRVQLAGFPCIRRLLMNFYRYLLPLGDSTTSATCKTRHCADTWTRCRLLPRPEFNVLERFLWHGTRVVYETMQGELCPGISHFCCRIACKVAFTESNATMAFASPATQAKRAKWFCFFTRVSCPISGTEASVRHRKQNKALSITLTLKRPIFYKPNLRHKIERCLMGICVENFY